MADKLLNHEALHAAHIAESMAAVHLLEHKAIAQNARWRKQAEFAHQALFDLYQMIGADTLIDDD